MFKSDFISLSPERTFDRYTGRIVLGLVELALRAQKYDLAVVGAGILGLSAALAAAKRGLKVVVLDRSARAMGASIRNFGFITVTGQDPEHTWSRARRSREIWLEVAGLAGIPIVQAGAWITTQRPEATAVVEEFMATEMSAGCQLLTQQEAKARCPWLTHDQVSAVLWSPHELRVESVDAIPQLARWLSERYGVVFVWNTTVQSIAVPEVTTTQGSVLADKVIVCPGDDTGGLYADRPGVAAIGRCQLQMLRLESPGHRLPGTVMSDLSLLRYGGFATLPTAQALRRRVATELPEFLQHGIHLIVAQSADGSLVVGDSHRYDQAISPFAEESIDRLILEEFSRVFAKPAPAVRARWMGTYAYLANTPVFVETPADNVRLAIVTSGIGASTGFAIGEELVSDLIS